MGQQVQWDTTQLRVLLERGTPEDRREQLGLLKGKHSKQLRSKPEG